MEESVLSRLEEKIMWFGYDNGFDMSYKDAETYAKIFLVACVIATINSAVVVYNVLQKKKYASNFCRNAVGSTISWGIILGYSSIIFINFNIALNIALYIVPVILACIWPAEQITYSGSASNNTNQIEKNVSNINDNGNWICPKCGEINPKYVTTCNCGEAKPCKKAIIVSGQSNAIDDSIPAGGWKCAFCGTVHAKYTQMCGCGKSKNDTEKLNQPQPVVSLEEKNKPDNIEADNIEKIKKYKELLDMGIITQDEFETKKKELLKF